MTTLTCKGIAERGEPSLRGMCKDSWAKSIGRELGAQASAAQEAGQTTSLVGADV
jgi:hypothetical protein